MAHSHQLFDQRKQVIYACTLASSFFSQAARYVLHCVECRALLPRVHHETHEYNDFRLFLEHSLLTIIITLQHTCTSGGLSMRPLWCRSGDVADLLCVSIRKEPTKLPRGWVRSLPRPHPQTIINTTLLSECHLASSHASKTGTTNAF